MTPYRFGASLFGELDRLQQQMSERFAVAARASRPDTFPPINVGTTDDAIEIAAFAPGMQAADFDVTVDKGLLTITGERHAVPAATPTSADDAAAGRDTHARPLVRERFVGRFRRAIELPPNADADKIDARYDDGCLRIRIAKRVAAQPRSIHVQ